MDIKLILVSALTSYVPAVLLMPLFIKLLHRWDLLDEPDFRKLHAQKIPAYGGIIIFLGYIASSVIWIPISEWGFLKFILLAQVIMILFGLRDDWSDLKLMEKLAGQIMSASVIIFLLDLRIENFYDLFPGLGLSYGLSVLISLIVIIGLTNAFNLIDGIDGLAGSIACFIFFSLGLWFLLIGDKTFAVLSFALFGATLSFIFFNWQPASIFMGDTGSLFLGISASILVIKAMNDNYGLITENPFRFSNTITIGICVFIYPIVDTLRVMMLRMSKGNSPFKPDRNHIHHLLTNKGFSHRSSTLGLLAIHLMFLLLGILSRDISDSVALPVLLVTILILLTLFNSFLKLRRAIS